MTASVLPAPAASQLSSVVCAKLCGATLHKVGAGCPCGRDQDLHHVILGDCPPDFVEHLVQAGGGGGGGGGEGASLRRLPRPSAAGSQRRGDLNTCCPLLLSRFGLPTAHQPGTVPQLKTLL